MTTKIRAQLILHGSMIILLGLLSGFLTVADSAGGPTRGWQSVHQTLLVFGVWMLATGSGGAALSLGAREARALMWSLVSAGYALLVVLVIRAATGVSGFSFGESPANTVAFMANVIVALGAILATLLTMDGAFRAAREHATAPDAPRAV